MDEKIKRISYLKSEPQFRVDKLSLAKVTELTKKSGLQAEQDKPKIILAGEELNQLLEKNKLLIQNGRPVLNKVFNNLTDKTRLMFICDSEGYVIDIASSPEILQWSFNNGVMLGSCIDYYSFGTNSISMSIYNDAPVVIIGDEHYCKVLKTWSCVAFPIRLHGKTIGFINVSDNAKSDLTQIIALVELMADLISTKIENYMSVQHVRIKSADNKCIPKPILLNKIKSIFSVKL